MSDEIVGPDQPIEPPPSRPRRLRWRRALIAAIILLSLLLVGGVSAQLLRSMIKSKAQVARALGKPVSVTVAEVTEEGISEVIGGTTLGQSFLNVAISCELSTGGRVAAIKADVGQLVTPGRVVAEFDTAVFRETLDKSRQEVESAKAALVLLQATQKTRITELQEALTAAKEAVEAGRTKVANAKLTYQRDKILYEQKVIALAALEADQLAWDNARSTLATDVSNLEVAQNAVTNYAATAQSQIEAAIYTLRVAEQVLAQARKDMENTVVKAQSAGVIATRTIAPGDFTKNGAALFTLDLIQPIYAAADIEQEKLPYVALAQDAEVVFDSYPTRVFRGKVAKIDPTVDATKRTFKTYVLLQNPTFEIHSNMAGFTRIRRGRRVTLVPRLAVINATGSPAVDATVFVVEDSRAYPRKVKLGKSEGLGRVEVISGLKAGELVVINNNREINPGEHVVTRTLRPPTKSESR